MFAIKEAYQAGLLQARHWPQNILAGVIVGIVALPLAMAFAIASGVKPEQGIYTAIIAGIIVSLAGGSRVQIAGPTGAFIVILAGIVAEHGIVGLQVATMMAGVILLILGAAKLGSIIRYIPDPVIIGFTSGIARTATNIRNGGNSPIAGVVHGLVLVIILLALAPLADAIPLAALSAILFVVAWNMSDAPHFLKMLRRAPRADIAILLITFSLTVFADLVVAVNIGVIIAMLHFVRRMASSVEVKAETQPKLAPALAQHQLTELPPGISVYTLEGPFFFAAAETFERTLGAIHARPHILILRFKWVPFMDITALQTLEEVIQRFQRQHTQVLISGANERVLKKLERAGIVTLVGATSVFSNFEPALAKALAALPTSAESPH